MAPPIKDQEIGRTSSILLEWNQTSGTFGRMALSILGADTDAES